MAVDPKTAKLIESVVRKHFADAVIDSVRVEKEAEYEDDTVFRVTVIFQGKGTLDAGKTSGITRHVRHALLEKREDRFPIFSFVSRADAAGMKPAAA